MAKNFQIIEEHKLDLIDLAKTIWNNPEESLKEYIAADACADLLDQYGFEVTRNYGGLETGLRAEYGSGKPVIGLIAEFDALPGLSQRAVPYRDPIKDQEYGHGCGHCLMCPSSIGAILAIREAMQNEKLEGTIVFIATPAEEVTAGKGIMASNGAFEDLDLALCWHPGKYNRSSYSRLVGANTKEYIFHGKSAHAGCDPHLGRSALDAVELMNVAANYLREHVPMDSRIHYCITHGGDAPNVVPDYASVKYTFRALNIETMDDIELRLDKIAEGACLMSGTTFETKNYGGCYPVINNHVVADVVDQSMREVKLEEWSDSDIEYAGKLNETIYDQWLDAVELSGNPEGTQLHVGIMPIDEENDYGSSDLGDISHMFPVCFYKGAGFPIGASYHSWQVTATVGMDIGFKSMMNGARFTAQTALHFFRDNELVKKAQKEFEESTKGLKYTPRLPD